MSEKRGPACPTWQPAGLLHVVHKITNICLVLARLAFVPVAEQTALAELDYLQLWKPFF